MTPPMADTIASFTSSWNPSVRTWAGLLSILGWVGVVPVLLLRAVAFVGHRWGHPDGSVSSLAHRLSFAMVPLGGRGFGAPTCSSISSPPARRSAPRYCGSCVSTRGGHHRNAVVRHFAGDPALGTDPPSWGWACY